MRHLTRVLCLISVGCSAPTSGQHTENSSAPRESTLLEPFSVAIGDCMHEVLYDGTVMADGSVVVVASSLGNLDSDSGAQILDDQNHDESGGFVIRTGPHGRLRWAKSITGQRVAVSSIDTSDLGMIVVAGSFSKSIDLDPGNNSEMRETSGRNDAFVVALDAAGAALWGATFGGTGEDYITDVVTGSDGKVFVTGSFEGDVDFNPGDGVETRNANRATAYVSAFDGEGRFLWSRAIGDGRPGRGEALARSVEGLVAVTGFHERSIDGDLMNAYSDSADSLEDHFVTVFTPHGEQRWSSIRESEANTRGESIVAIGDGWVVGGASERYSEDICPNFEVLLDEISVERFDGRGTVTWRHDVNGYDVRLAGGRDGGLYVFGRFSREIDLDFGSTGEQLRRSLVRAETDLFLVHLDHRGEYLRGTTFLGHGVERPVSIDLSPDGSLVVTGEAERPELCSRFRENFEGYLFFSRFSLERDEGAVIAPTARRGRCDSRRRFCTDDGWCQAHPHPHGYEEHALWSDGETTFIVGEQGLVFHDDGCTRCPLPSGTQATLLDVWGATSDDVFIVGEEGTLLHYDGTSVDRQESGTSQTLLAVWGTRHDDVYAVGVAGTILHFDGHLWTAMVSGTTATLRGVWTGTVGQAFVVGDGGTILRRDGQHWRVMPIDETSDLHDIWGSSPYDIYAVGDLAGVLHFDGESWSLQSSRHQRWRPMRAISGIRERGSEDGDISVATCGERGAVFERRNGRWLEGHQGRTKSASGSWVARDLAYTKANTLEILFHNESLGDLRWIRHQNDLLIACGPTLTLDADSLGPDYEHEDEERDCYGRGNDFALTVEREPVFNRGSHRSCVEAIWEGLLVRGDEPLFDVDGLGRVNANLMLDRWDGPESVVVAVGRSGRILSHDGSGWHAQHSGTTVDLHGVWGSALDDIFAVGHGGTILHWDGARWIAQRSGTQADLSDVFGSSDSDVWAVGARGTILHFDGTIWSSHSSLMTEDLNGLWVGSEGEAVIVGDNGTALRFDGELWDAEETGVRRDLFAVLETGTETSRVLAVGERGTILHWPLYQAESEEGLYSLYAPDEE